MHIDALEEATYLVNSVLENLKTFHELQPYSFMYTTYLSKSYISKFIKKMERFFNTKYNNLLLLNKEQ